MQKTLTAIAALSFLAGACARTAAVESTGEVVTPIPATSDALPVGSSMQVRLNQTLGTATSKVGDTFTASVVNPVVAQNGATVVPAGALVYGRVTGLHASQNAGDQAAIQIDFDSLNVNGTNHAFDAKVTTTELQTTGGDTRDETLKKAGIGAAAGAVLGAVLSGGDLQKILIGGALGAAAGTAISLGTGDVEAALPSGTTLTLQTTQMVSLR